MNQRFVQLTSENCKYLLNLIDEMDSETSYTERQRAYTVPKLKRILEDPSATKLAFQDVEYLLDLIEDDDLEESVEEKENARASLLDIQSLQQNRFDEMKNIEQQREARRSRRNPSKSLQEHFAHTRPQEI